MLILVYERVEYGFLSNMRIAACFAWSRPVNRVSEQIGDPASVKASMRTGPTSDGFARRRHNGSANRVSEVCQVDKSVRLPAQLVG